MVLIKTFPDNLLRIEKALVKSISIEPNFFEKRWLLCCAYNTKRMLIKSLISSFGNHVDLLILTDFNTEVNQT